MNKKILSYLRRLIIRITYELKLLKFYLYCKKESFFEKTFNGKKKKKILFIAMLDSIHTARWISQFNDLSNFKIHIFPSTVDGKPHLLIKNNKKIIIHTYYFDEKNYFLEKIIKYLQPDIIHTLEMQHAAYKILPIKQKRLKNFPLWLYSCWGSDIKWFEQFSEHKKHIVQVLKECNALFCEDKETIKKIIDSYGFKKPILNVHAAGGFRINCYKNKFKSIPPSKRKNIIFKGYSGWVYKVETIIEALKLCKKEILNKKLKIIVYLPSDILRHIIELRSLGLEVELFKRTDDYDKVMELFSTAKISIAANLSDGVPTSMLENMFMGAFPIQSISNLSGGPAEYIINGRNGVLLDPTDVSGYAKAIKNAIQNNKLLDNAAKYNFELIKKNFDYKIIQAKVIKFYEKLLKMRIQ